jgi:hypothetical protein
MFNQLRMNLRPPMSLFPEIFDGDPLLDGHGKRLENVRNSVGNCCLRARQFTFILADSSMDGFSEGSRTAGQVSDQPAVAFDGIAFMLLDGEGRLRQGLRQSQGASPSSPGNYPDGCAAFRPRNSIYSILLFFSLVHRHSADG